MPPACDHARPGPAAVVRRGAAVSAACERRRPTPSSKRASGLSSSSASKTSTRSRSAAGGEGLRRASSSALPPRVARGTRPFLRPPPAASSSRRTRRRRTRVGVQTHASSHPRALAREQTAVELRFLHVEGRGAATTTGTAPGAETSLEDAHGGANAPRASHLRRDNSFQSWPASTCVLHAMRRRGHGAGASNDPLDPLINRRPTVEQIGQQWLRHARRASKSSIPCAHETAGAQRAPVHPPNCPASTSSNASSRHHTPHCSHRPPRRRAQR